MLVHPKHAPAILNLRSPQDVFPKWALLGVLVFLFCGSSEAVETVTVDFGNAMSVVDQPVATGILGRPADSLPDSFLYLIKPSAIRGIGNEGLPADSIWVRAAHTKSYVIIALCNKLYNHPSDHVYGQHWDVYNASAASKMNDWKNHVAAWVDSVEAHRIVGSDTVKVQYDIWNEPDVSWHPAPEYGNSIDLFFQVWKTAYTEIRKDPLSVITGPSLGYAGNGAGSEITSNSGITMNLFLQRCYADTTLPDVLGSHCIGYSDYLAPNSLDGPCRWNLYGQLVDLRARVDSVFASIGAPLNKDSFKYEFNEITHDVLPNPGTTCAAPYTGPPVRPWITPGVLLRHFALAERARADGLGLLLACRTIWCDPCPGGCPPVGLGTSLNSLLDPCLAHAGQFRKRYAWWTYRTYANIPRNYKRATSTGFLDALAGTNANGDSARVVIGNYSPSINQDTNIILQNISSTLIVNEAVNVSIKRIPGHQDTVVLGTPGLAPATLSRTNVPVYNLSASIFVPGSNLRPGDVLSIEITKINPDTVTAQEDFVDIQTSINSTLAGNVVIVKPPQLAPFHQESITMRAGIKVIGQAGTMPKIRGVTDTTITFPANANLFTAIEGVEIQAGTTTKALVSLKGAGAIRNCILRDMGAASAITGIRARSHSGQIRNCTIEMTSHAHTPAQTVYGIILGEQVETNSSHVVNCFVNVKNGDACDSWGIGTSVNAQALIESTLVKAETFGISVDGTTIVQYCTADSTYYNGIAGAGYIHSLRNCIATNVLHPSWAGIVGWDVRYCMSPTGITVGGYEIGNVTEDPGFCGQNTYTVKADSYANPSNNPSGKQIGAFPVACVYGTLARNVTWTGMQPPLLVPGDVTVPAGKSLILSNGAVVKCGPGDKQGSGIDSQATEINILGSMSVSGPSAVRFTSAAASPAPGNWQGIRSLNGSVSIDSAVVEYADVGLFCGSVSGTVKRVIFRNNLTFDIECAKLDTVTSLSLEQNRLETAGASGIKLVGSNSTVTVKQCTILRVGSTGNGIWLTDNNEFATPNLTQNTITGFLAGAGIQIDGGSPRITKNTISTCATGIRITTAGYPGEPEIGEQGNSSSDNVITGNTVGISAQYPGCDPVIRENKIQNNSSGIVAKNGAIVDAGKSGQGHGNNWITGNTTYCIWNRNPGGNPQISAKYNYFGACQSGQMPTCWSGSVDISQWLCTAPAGAGAIVEMEALPESRAGLLSVSPNPTDGSATLTLVVEQERGSVQIDAFDVAGRLVRKVTDDNFDAGRHEVYWDGRGQSGERVSPGIYFLRVRMAGRGEEVTRLLVLHRGGGR